MNPEVALAVIGGAQAAKGLFQINASNERTRAIELEASQRRLQYQQKTLANYDLTNKILDSQIVQASARGVALSSPSLEATQRNTTNIAARSAKNLEIEEDIFERNVKNEKKNVQRSLIAQLLGDVTEFSDQAIGVKKAFG
jgi:hypothetical protein